MQYLDYDKTKIKWDGESPINKTFLIAPMGIDSPIMIFDASGKLLKQTKTNGFPAHFVQLDDLSGYSYFSGRIHVGKTAEPGHQANGRYTVGKLYITDNNLETKKIIDYIPTELTSNAIGLHMHGNYVLDKEHYLLQIISMEEVLIDSKPSYVVNCILQEQLNGEVVWEWQSIDYPELFKASFARNNYFDKDVINKKYACDYAHMNSVIKTSDNQYMYISFKHIGIVKIDYKTKNIIWIIGPNAKTHIKLPNNALQFAHQHDLHLIDDNTFYFWDNEHFCYTELRIIDNKVTHYKSIPYPTKCNLAVMGNALKVSDSIVDICYGLRNPLLPHIYLQPIISEFDLNTGKKLMELTIYDKSDELVNVMYQVNRGVNIYED